MNPLFYPSRREIKWIVDELDAWAVGRRVHKQSDVDAFNEREREEGRKVLEELWGHSTIMVCNE